MLSSRILCMLVAIAASPAVYPEETDSIFDANRDRAKALESVMLEETLEAQWRSRRTFLDRTVTLLNEKEVERFRKALSGAESRGATSAELDALTVDHLRRLADIDATSARLAINNIVRRHRLSHIEIDVPRARYVDEDLRDVDAMLAAASLGSDDAWKVAAPRITIRSGGKDIQIFTDQNRAAIIPTRINSVSLEHLHLGIVPPNILAANLDFHRRQPSQETNREVTLVGTSDTHNGRVEIVFDSQEEYCVTGLRVFSHQTGQIVCKYEVSEFLELESISIPRRTRLELFRNDSADRFYSSTRNVTRGSVNAVGYDDEMFKIPKGTIVQDFTEGSSRPFRQE